MEGYKIAFGLMSGLAATGVWIGYYLGRWSVKRELMRFLKERESK